MKNLKQLKSILFLVLLSPSLLAQVQMMTGGRGPASSFTPTIKTCEFIEDDSYINDHNLFKTFKINASERFCKEYISVKIEKGEIDYNPCKSPDYNRNFSYYDFEYNPNHFKKYAEIAEYYLFEHLKLPTPRTKEPIDLPESELKVLGYLCTRTFIEEAEYKLITGDGFWFREYIIKYIEKIKKRGLLTYMISTNTGVDLEIFAFNKYPRDVQREIFFLYLEEASQDEVNKASVKKFFEANKYEIENNTILGPDDEIGGKHLAMMAVRVKELTQEYKALPAKDQKQEVLDLLKEVGF